MSDPLWKLSACELLDGYAAGTFSSADAVESVVARIEARNGELNALITDFIEDPIAAAHAVDTRRSAGEDLPPLAGVPVTIKENIDVTGQPTTNGLPALKDLIATDDSPLVKNLKEAGAIIVGRSNTPELSMRGTTYNPLRGRTNNPWDSEISCGGSSGGAGSACAAGFGPIHHGNDIGGSLRFPASLNGVVTVKPTPGRIPAFVPSATEERGMLATLMAVQGALCREVRDLKLSMLVMSQGDPRDPWWAPTPLFDWPEEPGPIKVAVTKEDYGWEIHPGVAETVDRAAAILSDAGYAVEEVETPSMQAPAQCWIDVFVHELNATLGSAAREMGSEEIVRIFDYYARMGNVVDADGYRRGIASRTALTREWNVFLAEYPLVLTPFLLRPGYPWNYDAQGFEQARDLLGRALYSTGVNYLALPAGNAPMGLVEGAPSGVQIIGRRWREDQIMDALEVVEASVGLPSHQLWAREQGE